MNSRLRYFSIALAACLVLCMIVPQSQAQQTQVFRAFATQDSSGAFLGIRMTNVTKENMAEHKLNKVEGVIVESVVEDSPAESAGIKEDDVLLDFDGVKVRSTLQLSRLVRETPVGREVAIVVSRDGRQENLSATLEEQSNTQADNQDDWMGRFFYGDNPPRNFNFDILPAPERPDRSLVIPAPGRPRLGITLQPLSEQLADYMGVPGGKGVLVASVEEGSVSDGKLKAGDVIVSADNKNITAPEDVINLVRQKDSGSIEFKVIREKRTISVSVEVSNQTGGSGRGFRL